MGSHDGLDCRYRIWMLQVAGDYGSNTAMKASTPSLIVTLLVLGPLSLPAAESADPVVSALHVSLARNLVHAREWLDQKDYKSLGQSAGNLKFLAELQKSRSDDKQWQGALEIVLLGTTAVQTAARLEDSTKCTQALDALDKAAITAMVISPTGKPTTYDKPPATRPMMLLMDAILADAKVSLSTGHVDAAKKQIRVLAELGKLVSNSRTTPAWKTLGDDFVAASTKTADSPETDSQAVRQLIRGVSQRCEACHEKSRTRQ
jgi:hypothetical protein